MAAMQVNIRMDDSLKQAGDEVLERYGFSATQAIRALWEYVAHSGEVPDFMLSAEPDADECARKLALIEGGEGPRGGGSQCARGWHCLHSARGVERGAVGGGLCRTVRISCRGGLNGRAV